jgi:hypothetical protein
VGSSSRKTRPSAVLAIDLSLSLTSWRPVVPSWRN